MGFIKKLFRPSSIIGIVLVVWGGYFAYSHFIAPSKVASTANNVTVKVKSGSISSTIKALGTTNIVNEQSLHFGQGGTVSNIYYKEGDTVKQGDIIATLDETTLQNQISQAQLSLQASQIALTKLLDTGSTLSSTLKAKADVDSTQYAIDSANVTLANLQQTELHKLQTATDTITTDKYKLALDQQDASTSVTSNQTGIDQAKINVQNDTQALALARQNLASAQASNSESYTGAVSTYTTAINNAVTLLKNIGININNALYVADGVLGVQDPSRTSGFSNYLGVKDKNTFASAQSLDSILYGQKTDITAYYSNFSGIDPAQADKSTLISNLQASLAFDNQLVTLLNQTYTSLQNSIAGPNLTTTQISTLQSSISSVQSSIQNDVNSITNSINTINSLTSLSTTQISLATDIATKQNAVNTAQANLTKDTQTLSDLQNTLGVKNASKNITVLNDQNTLVTDEKNYDDTKASYDAQILSAQQNIDNLQKQLQINQTALAETVRGPTEEEIAAAKNDIAQKTLSISIAKQNLKNYEIIAPFDGTLREIDYKVGDTIVTNNDTKYIYIHNPNIVEIDILLDQTSIVQLKPGMHATLTFTAYPGVTFDGVVTLVSGLPTTTSGVTSYQVKLTLTDTKGKSFYTGMTQNVVITLATKDNVLLVPTMAISSARNKKFVNVQTATGAVRTTIQTGLTDGLWTEVDSGVSEGDPIIMESLSGSGGSASGGSPFSALRLGGAAGGGWRRGG